MLVVFLSAISHAGNVLLDKFVLSKRKMKLGEYIPLLFGFLFIVTLITLPWLGDIKTFLAFTPEYMFYFLLMVMLAIMWNIFYYEGLQHEKIVEFEMVVLLTPLVTVLLATLFFPEEFQLPVFIAAIVGSIALILSHVRKHHLDMDKYSMRLVLAVILIAMEAMVQKELLRVYSPAALYTARTAVIALFFYFYYQPKIEKVHGGDYQVVLMSAILGAFSMVTRYYGFNQLGVTMTTLVLLIVPIITSWLDAKMNRQRISRRTILAFIVIVACVAYATIAQSLSY